MGSATKQEMAVHSQPETGEKRSVPGGAPDAAAPMPDAAAKKGGVAILQKWELLIIILTVAPMAGFTVLNPYQQTLRADLGCDAICIGTITSASSALGLFGSPLVGALSDQMGRKVALALGALASALGFSLVAVATSMPLLWLSVIPGSLLAHNFTIAKALVADLAKPEDRAGVMGKLGLAAGVGFMVGPVINPFISSLFQACFFATGLQLLSLIAVYQLPSRSVAAAEPALPVEAKAPVLVGVVKTVWKAIKEVFVLAVAAPPAARLILFLRFGMSMGFHVFYTVMQAIIKDKFKFQPTDYSNYFAFIGLTYAFSQLISRSVINRFGKNQTFLLIPCFLLLGGGRFVTATTDNIYIFYGGIVLTVGALGIVNTSISTTITRIASDSNVGGLMGVLDTSEKLAGIGGPAIGGALYAYSTFAPVIVVCMGYFLLAVAVFVGYPRYVLPAIDHKERESTETKEKTE